MNVIEVLEKRYSAKAFDPSKEISKEDMEKIETILQLSPSSTNIQPWHFVIAATKEGKEKIAKSTEGFFVFNKEKVLNASAVVVFATKTDIDSDYFNRITNREDEQGRYANEEIKQGNHGARAVFAGFHKYDYKDQQHWMDKQVYLNLGNFLLGVASLGIDALPMEGIDYKTLDAELGLREKGFTSTIVVAIGYHSEDDFNFSLPKSRLPKEEIITRL